MTNFFKTRREELELTQWDVAIAIGVKTSAVSSWENEISCPKLVFVPKLAEIYKVTEQKLTEEMVAMNNRIIARRKKVRASAH